MGLFSKIFGNSDEPSAGGPDAARTEPEKGTERDTSPPTRTGRDPNAKDDVRAAMRDAVASPRTTEGRTAEPASRPRRSKPPAARAGVEKPSPQTATLAGPATPQAAQAAAQVPAAPVIQSPRPSVPPKVEATLLSSSRPEPPARAAGAKTEGKRDAAKKAAAAPSPVASSTKAVAAAPIRPIGARSGNPPPVPEAKPVEPPKNVAPANAPPLPNRGARDGVPAEPLELELASVAPPPEAPVHHDDVDHAFDRIVSLAPNPGAPGALVVDEQAKKANREMFRAMAASHARPVKDFLLELIVGPTTKQWLDVARPAAESIERGAAEIAEPELATALSTFCQALQRAAGAVGPKIDGAEREALIRAHAALSAALPEAFDLGKERDRREPIVVRHLLLQVPGVHKVTIDKLYAAGLASLDALCRSTVDDLVQLGRLERDGADAISSRFRAYWSERASEPVHRSEDRARKKLGNLLEQLGIAHEAFQRAEADEDREKKRAARNSRRASALAINVLLAQLGEVDLVEELERSPTERRIVRVRSYVDQMARARMQKHEEAV